MDMAAKFQDQTVFHLTGKLAGEGLTALSAGYRPALLAGYQDLTRLRFDYPVVLLGKDTAGQYARSLLSVVNELLTELAPRGLEGERLRKHVLRLEREIRMLLSGGTRGSLSELWAAAAERLADPDDASVQEMLVHAGNSLVIDGELHDCDAGLASRFLSRAWHSVHAEKAAEFRRLVDRLLRKLADILRAAHIHSQAGQQPAALQSAFGTLHAEAFDFGAMSRLVTRHVPHDELPASRRARIEWALSVLRSQPFFPDPKLPAPAEPSYEFVFDNCAAVIESHRARLPRLVEVLKAITIAELEAGGAYVEARHDPFFERYDEHALTADDLAQFPDYLVCIPPERNDAAENAALMDMLSAGLPVKVVVQHTDLLEEAAIGQGHFAFGVRSARLATTAMGLGGMFVLQAASSNVVALRDSVRKGMRCRGPALFSVFVGSPAGTSDLPAYLTAAAAMESRAFPTFSYDANAGSNWATRFSLENNRDPEADWPNEDFEYSDEDLQRVQERVAFTYAEFALCDRRHAHHFALVPRERWTMAMLPAADWLRLPERDAAERVPYVLAVDGAERLHRVIVDARLMQATRRALLLWHRLQEHGGVHNSHAEQALAREKAAWEAQKQQELTALQVAPLATASEPATAAATAVTETVAEAGTNGAAEAKPPSDEPWIETTRCSSCNECRNINDKLFGYNENKQAFIADVTAGTYRQLIEAAESCQVAIIHPGKPKNPNEPGLAELLERAKPFQ
jgi:hypothetical protein